MTAYGDNLERALLKQGGISAKTASALQPLLSYELMAALETLETMADITFQSDQFSEQFFGLTKERAVFCYGYQVVRNSLKELAVLCQSLEREQKANG